MKILTRILAGLVILLFLLASAAYLFLQGTRPEYEGEVHLQGLHAETEVYYDPYGVPHIYAQNSDDAYFALGYVHAQDRLFQMEMLRRAAAGRLSEVLGKDFLPVDRLFRTLGLNEFAKKHAAEFLRTDSLPYQKAALAYQQGINAYIKNGKTPVEFTIIGIPKADFTPEDIYLAMGFMSFGFAEGITVDPVMEKIRSQLGEAYLKDLAVQPPKDAVMIKSFKGERKTISDSVLVSLHEAISKIPVPLWSGSNGWAIAGTRTASGFPIVANDTHMGYAQPAVWYEAHLEYPGFSFYGHHAAGVPFALLGNNKFCAWGLTMFENDDADFYVETADEAAHPGQVKFGDQWENLTVREEVIKVKDEQDVNLQIKSSRHGPIINGIKEDFMASQPPVSLWWLVNQQMNRGLQAFYKLNHAANFDEAREAASMFSSPGLNVMYGDRAGNVAWWASARLPVRPAHVNSKFFLDGASGKDEPVGFYDFEKNPQAVNPPWGFTYSANNQPDTVDGVLYPGYYYPRARAGRIVELLSEQKKWTVADVKKVNLDVTTSMHARIAETMVEALKEANDPELQVLVDALAGWNGRHEMEDVAPSVYYNLLANIMNLMLKDEIGPASYDALMVRSMMANSYDLLIGNAQSPWWDNIQTKESKETRADIMKEAGRRSLASLTETCGSNPTEWTWGKIHRITHRHALGAVKPLDKLFNVGPYYLPGGNETINSLEFDLDTTGYFEVTHGPALRKITDLSDTGHGETISPTGQSGNVMSAHYQDQAKMFANGQSRPMMMVHDEILKSSTKLLLKP